MAVNISLTTVLKQRFHYEPQNQCYNEVPVYCTHTMENAFSSLLFICLNASFDFPFALVRPHFTYLIKISVIYTCFVPITKTDVFTYKFVPSEFSNRWKFIVLFGVNIDLKINIHQAFLNIDFKRTHPYTPMCSLINSNNCWALISRIWTWIWYEWSKLIYNLFVCSTIIVKQLQLCFIISLTSVFFKINQGYGRLLSNSIR